MMRIVSRLKYPEVGRNLRKVKQSQKIIGPLSIESLANGGSGIARDDGRVVFVPGTAPGDTIMCRVLKEKKRYALAELVEILQPSELRHKPVCTVAEKCGGCQWQHLTYADQLIWKERLFHESLRRQLGVNKEQLLPIIPAPHDLGYRSRVQIKCQVTRSDFVCGFFQPKSNNVVPVSSCPVMAPELNELLAELHLLLAASPLAEKIPQIDLAADDNNKCLAVVHYIGSKPERLVELLSAFAWRENVDILLKPGPNGKLTNISGSGTLSITVDQPPLTLTYSAGGFAQINLVQNRQLVSAVLDAAELTGRERVLDLYCGMGNFSLPLARRAEIVCGVEDFAPSIEMARKNATDNRLSNVDFHSRTAENAWSELSTRSKYDLLVLDPPRSGAYEVMLELLQTPVQRLLYVSCDPQTLSRDLKVLLNNNYRLVSSQPFDMFPQTFHCESLSVLEYCH